MIKSFSEIFFGKKINELSFNDIESFFEYEQEENSILEFKSGQVEIESIYKEVTGFLNTEGGILIIGTPKESKKGNKTICKGKLTNANFKSKDWLSQKIISNIQPNPNGIKIIEREQEGVKVFVCEIEQSYNPPHQCSIDGKYYIRLESEAKFAPHGIVSSLFNKRKLPEISVDIDVSILDNLPIYHRKSYEISFNIKNLNSNPTDIIHYIITVYNVQTVYHKEFSKLNDAKIKKYSYSSKIDFPLINGIAHPFKFSIDTIKKNTLVSIMIWSKEYPMYFKYLMINNSEDKIEYCRDLNDEDILFKDALNELE
jgi:hypothetical protein